MPRPRRFLAAVEGPRRFLAARRETETPMPSATRERKKNKESALDRARHDRTQKGAGKKPVKAPKQAAKAADKPKKPKKSVPSKGDGKSKSKGKPKAPKDTAATADRYDLYQRAVNSPEADVDFLIKVYGQLRDGQRPRHLREDFCGTANLAAEWLKRGPEMTAEGFDLDPEPIEWGKRVNFASVPDTDERMTFHVADVRSRASVRPDITTAPNFSYWCFRTREEMKSYFRSALEDLAPGGLFVLDVYGGPESIVEMEEQRDIDGKFTYVWDQRQYWPGTGEYHTAIHFRFKDGTELYDAFQYLWRFWHLTELRDILTEVGFKSVGNYFEGTDPEDEEAGDGNFELDEKGENCQAWIGYIVAAK
jgi:SAM-dependent methyltransferase